MEDREKLQKALYAVEQRIEELERRIPPHSVQPHLIRELDRLESERDRILDRLNHKEKL